MSLLALALLGAAAMAGRAAVRMAAHRACMRWLAAAALLLALLGTRALLDALSTPPTARTSSCWRMHLPRGPVRAVLLPGSPPVPQAAAGPALAAHPRARCAARRPSSATACPSASSTRAANSVGLDVELAASGWRRTSA